MWNSEHGYAIPKSHTQGKPPCKPPLTWRALATRNKTSSSLNWRRKTRLGTNRINPPGGEELIGKENWKTNDKKNREEKLERKVRKPHNQNTNHTRSYSGEPRMHKPDHDSHIRKTNPQPKTYQGNEAPTTTWWRRQNRCGGEESSRSGPPKA